LPRPVELRRVDRPRQDAADVDPGAVLLELGARRLEIRPHRRLGRAVGSLQRMPRYASAELTSTKVPRDSFSAGSTALKSCTRPKKLTAKTRRSSSSCRSAASL